jgi:hypothetical protein
MRSKHILTIALFFALQIVVAHGVDAQSGAATCQFGDRRMAPTADVAAKIFIAVVNGSGSRAHPLTEADVSASDGGDYWDVGEISREPAVQEQPDKPGQITIRMGGGQPYGRIDKCTGAVLKLAYLR